MFDGILMPLLTPFEADGGVDEDTLLSITDHLIGAGVHALFVLGSAGQGPVMELDERARAADLVVRHVKGRVPVMVHVGTAYLETTQELARKAAESGADGIAAVPPYYYSDHPEAEIDAHLIAAAKSTSLPFLVYNNERYTGINITAPWLKRLSEHIPNMCGIKLSYTSQGVIFQYLDLMPEHVGIFTASTLELLPTAPFGVRGCINPPSILFPELAVAMWETLKAKDYAYAFELQDRVKRTTLGLLRLERRFGRFVIAEGLRLRGHPVKRYPRWQQGEKLTEECKSEIAEILEYATVPAGRR